jgi:hypothetical protein
MDWITLVKNSDHLHALVNTIMDQGVPYMAENFLIVWTTISFLKISFLLVHLFVKLFDNILKYLIVGVHASCYGSLELPGLSLHTIIEEGSKLM